MTMLLGANMGMKRRLCNGTLYKILIGKVAASFPNNNLKDMSFRTERQCSEESPYRCYKLDFVTFSTILIDFHQKIISLPNFSA
jgi:hypothetical protein